MTTPALETVGLTKQFGHTWGLRECTFAVPQGKVAALVGPNGAGKSTLLRIAAGLARPTAGMIKVLGEDPGGSEPDFLRRVGYLDQERPLYGGFRVEEMFRFGGRSNPSWDMTTAHAYVEELGISLGARVDKLSSGQRAQVALTMCLAKQPELLILDEPAAALDPVAREDLLRLLMRQVEEQNTTVVLSTHALDDISLICDYLIILLDSKVVLADEMDFIIESHRFLSSSLPARPALPEGLTVIDTRSSDREVTHLVRMSLPMNDDTWRVTEPTLDEIILAYLRIGRGSSTFNGRPNNPSPGDIS